MLLSLEETLALHFPWLPFVSASVRHRNEREFVERVRERSQVFSKLSSKTLSAESDRLRSGSVFVKHDLLVDAISLIAEAVRRVTGKTYYDVQLIAGWKLVHGGVAEVQTGEGKTLITAIPAYVFALAGRGVHIATTNDYLSRRDYETTRPALRLLGITVSHLDIAQEANAKRNAYACDITYGPGYEFGFDYLRDQIERRKTESMRLGQRYIERLRGQRFEKKLTVQRPCAFAIIDEADSVLIDEANTPLVLGGREPGPQTDSEMYCIADQFAMSLAEGEGYQVQNGGIIELTERGRMLARNAFENLPRKRMSRSWNTLVHNALKARMGLMRDVDYVVRDGEVQIVDANTGRIHGERRWQGGLHQAVEVAAGLSPSIETMTEARITRQRYCQYYETLCGLTGTASDNLSDFREFYRLDVSVIPTHQPCRRKTEPARYFANSDNKLRFVVQDATRRSRNGQPVLIGTRSIHESHAVAREVQRHVTLLNGVQDEEEASIVSRAGEPGSITIATNMAGRGTDIIVGEKAKSAGGLHVIATEHQDSRRVDRQLAGRAARQGDPGSVQFLACAQDTLIEENDPDLTTALARIDTCEGIVSPHLDLAVARLQQAIERTRFEKRRQMVARDAWLENFQNTLARTA